MCTCQEIGIGDCDSQLAISSSECLHYCSWNCKLPLATLQREYPSLCVCVFVRVCVCVCVCVCVRAGVSLRMSHNCKHKIS